MLKYAVIAVLHASLWSQAWSSPPELNPRALPSEVCLQIKDAISSDSGVYFADDPRYVLGVKHFATSSSEVSACVVEPNNAKDLGIILGIVGKTCTSFAVKGGGHSLVAGTSSTTGVQITMTRFSEVSYDPSCQKAVIGAGQIWDNVYGALAPYNVTVVGGRVPGVGVAGLTLGAGYSWLTNQYGLTIDTVEQFELVQTNGVVVNVTETSDPDLFLSLKGGLNNFGVVTRFTLKTFPIGQVWGGGIIYGAPTLDNLTAACERFASTVTDPKAAIITAYNYILGNPVAYHIMFYDGPNPPAGIFDDFLAIPSISKDVSTRDYLSMIRSSPSNISASLRGRYNTIPFDRTTTNLLHAIANETKYWGAQLSALDNNTFTSYAVEPFLPSILSHTSLPSAYPSTRSRVYLPFNIYFAWSQSSLDQTFDDAIRETGRRLTDVVRAEGQTDVDTAPPYSNYALPEVPVERLYGEKNLAIMRAVKARVDPDNIMRLTGGFKI